MSKPPSFTKVNSHKETASFKGKFNDLADRAASWGTAPDAPMLIQECTKYLPNTFLIHHSDTNKYCIREHKTYRFIFDLLDKHALHTVLSSKKNKGNHISFIDDPKIWRQAACRLRSWNLEHNDIFGMRTLTHSLATPRNISNKPDMKKYLPKIFPSSICTICHKDHLSLNQLPQNGQHVANEFHCTCYCQCISDTRTKISSKYYNKILTVISPLFIHLPFPLWNSFLFPKLESAFTHGKPPELLHEWLLQITGHADDTSFDLSHPNLRAKIEKSLYYLFRDAYFEVW